MMEKPAAGMELPPVFVANIIHSFGDAGQRFLADLPSLLEHAAGRWKLVLGKPFLLSYNYVCAATLPDGTPAVLKVGVPDRELTSEMTALRLYDGEGACRLYDCDPEMGMLLEERLLPGRMLHEHADDETQTVLAARVMRRLWHPAPPGAPLITLHGWFDELHTLRPRFHGGTGPYPRRLVETVESLLPDLFAGGGEPVVLHGDCHHYNILESSRGWLVVDPKGVIGPRGYEPAPLLTNPYPDLLKMPGVDQLTLRRIHILSEVLEIPREVLHAWGICHSLLSSFWDLDEKDHGGEFAMACGEMLLDLKV